MKKLIVLFSFVAFLSLIFMSCQSTENITSPGELNKQPNPPTLTWLHPTAVNTTAGASTDVDLVAGQDQVCGHITISSDGSHIFITYYTDSDWTITETHIMVVADPSNFIVTSTGNPKVGQFPYGETGLSTNQTMTYEIPYPSGVVAGDTVFVGAHAVVENCELDPNSATLCPTFAPDSMTPHYDPANPLYTVQADFDNQGTYYGFCLDNTRYISSGSKRGVDFLCSYDDMPICGTGGLIEVPDNLDLVNWIINARDTTTWSRAVIQAAIWELINPSGTLVDWHPIEPILREQIVTWAEQYGEGFRPTCGQRVLTIVWGTLNGDICHPYHQVVGIETPVECQTNCGSETAWAFNFPIDGTSAEFPGNNWFRYFGYLVN